MVVNISKRDIGLCSWSVGCLRSGRLGLRLERGRQGNIAVLKRNSGDERCVQPGSRRVGMATVRGRAVLASAQGENRNGRSSGKASGQSADSTRNDEKQLRKNPVSRRSRSANGTRRAGSTVRATPSSGGSGSDVDTKLKVAAKISAARSLARKLSEEKAAVAAAAELMSKSRVDGETAKELKLSAEQEVAAFAKEAGTADAAARSARQTKTSAPPDAMELERLKRENEKLQQMVMQLAKDREEAERKLQELPLAVREELGSSVSTKSDDKEEKVKSKVKKKLGRVDMLEHAIKNAEEQNQRVAIMPSAPVQVGTTVEILYHSSAGPLPKENMSPALKLGLNRWESQEKFPMSLVDEKKEFAQGWYVATIELPPLLYRVDFVVEDQNSGAVDNNGGADFSFELENAPTAEEVTAQRIEMLEKFESEINAIFEKQEEMLYNQAMKAAEGASKEARLNYIAQRKAEILHEAKEVVEERRLSSASDCADALDGVYKWITPPTAGLVATIIYNRAHGPLSNSTSVSILVGYDGWWMQDKVSIEMSPLSPAEAAKYGVKSNDAESDWWIASIPIWNTAATVDFVFSDSTRQVWDNMGGSDYHTKVHNATSKDTLVELVFKALEASDAEYSVTGEEMAGKRVLRRAAVKAEASKKRRDLQRNFLFSLPNPPEAGKKATVYYNPDRTVLRGRPDVFLSGGFDRGKHQEMIEPVLMEPAVPQAGGLGFLKAVVDIPSDAYLLDLTFQDSADKHGGFYDTYNGLGYHIPVHGSTKTDSALFVAHIASEMAPIAKAGGLGDVVTALGRAVQEEGHEVEVVIPKYDCIDYSSVSDLRLDREYMWEGIQVKVWKGFVEGLATTFLEPCNGLFWVGSIYTDMNGDRHRFGIFCACALHYLVSESPKKPSLLHCHDWQSAPIAFMERREIPCIFTIHNMDFGADLISRAVESAEISTTVSPTYATEISGHSGIAPHHEKFYGIRNGIDMDIWDPSSDPCLPVHFTEEDLVPGKLASKRALREKLNLADGDVPIVGCVTRLTHQKGIHLIKHAAWRAMERGAQFVLLGSAPDPAVQAEFQALADDLKQQYPDRARLWFAYDEPLSHLIFAGCDMFLVPSMFEPCGLTQMIAMRYGTVPVVRRTGGLADTVFDVNDDVEKANSVGLEPNGFSFDGSDAGGLDYALNRALSFWFSEKEAWIDLSKRIMSMDWSWADPAQDYIQLYYKAISKRIQ